MIVDFAGCACPEEKEQKQQEQNGDPGEGSHVAGSGEAGTNKIEVENHERARQREIAA